MKRFIIALILVIVIVVASTTIAYYLIKPPEVQTYSVEMSLKISNYTGMNVGTDKIYFGTINLYKPTRMQREFSIINPFKASRAYTSFRYEGEIVRFIQEPPEDVLLEPREQRNISISTLVANYEGVEMGTYNGTLFVSFRRT